MSKRSLVLELQNAAQSRDHSVIELLRKALVISTKLKIEDFKAWIENELNGYRGQADEDVPAYRHATAEIKAVNPVTQRFMMITFEDADEAFRHSQVVIRNGIAEIERMAEATEGSCVLDFSPHDLARFQNQDRMSQFIKPRKFLTRQVPVRIASAVRDTVLRWSLKLEEEGLTGDDMTFSKEEQQRAAQTPTVHIEHFHGVYGSVSGGNVQIGDYASIHSELKKAGVSQKLRNEVENMLDELKAAKPEERPGLVQRGMDWIARNGKALGALTGIIKKALESPHP